MEKSLWALMPGLVRGLMHQASPLTNPKVNTYLSIDLHFHYLQKVSLTIPGRFSWQDERVSRNVLWGGCRCYVRILSPCSERPQSRRGFSQVMALFCFGLAVASGDDSSQERAGCISTRK